VRSPSRDLAIPLGVLVWAAVALGLDTGASPTQQLLLGAGTWLLLVGVLLGEALATRVQVGVVVVFATVIEYVFAGWLQVYAYRLEGVPAFVPPGHGLVYLAALAIGRSAFAATHRRALLSAMLLAGGAWTLWGLTLSARPDILGAFWYGCLVLFTWKGRSPLLYVGAFVVVSYLELVGTGLGTWTWGRFDPTGVVPIGNPPSGIAGGYAWFDTAALWLTPVLTARWQIWRSSGHRTAWRGHGRPGTAYPAAMARGRHTKPTGLWPRLSPGRVARLRAALERERVVRRELRDHVHRLLVLGAEHAAEAARVAVQSAQAQATANAALAQVSALRQEVARLREELLWAWAEGRLPAAPMAPPVAGTGSADELPSAAASESGVSAMVIDLRGAAAG